MGPAVELLLWGVGGWVGWSDSLMDRRTVLTESNLGKTTLSGAKGCVPLSPSEDTPNDVLNGLD